MKKNSASVSSHVEDGENLQHKALVWGNHTCYDLTQVISAVYDEIAKRFVEETTRLITEWNNQTPLGNAALKCLLIICLLSCFKNKVKKFKARSYKMPGTSSI